MKTIYLLTGILALEIIFKDSTDTMVLFCFYGAYKLIELALKSN